MSATSVKEQFARLRKARTKRVKVGTEEFIIRMISGKEAERFHDVQADKNAKPVASMARLVALALSDDAGERVVPDADEATLADLPIAVLLDLFKAAAAFNKLDAESIEGAEGNSVGVKPASSPSA